MLRSFNCFEQGGECATEEVALAWKGKPNSEVYSLATGASNVGV